MTHPTLRLTPSNSPFFINHTKNNGPRSPTRKTVEEPGLQLRKVVGTTTSSSNGFDALPAERCFAYTAGAAAVVATVDDNLQTRQRFFRARPAATGASNENSSWAASPSPLAPKHRALGAIRDSTAGSPFSSSVNGRNWDDSPGGRAAKDRVKAATSVALSPNGKWLAVGETGYKPRILIFSLAEGSSETPVASLCEHMYGVHCLRFSPDSRYLASLGTVNDGFLYVWSISDRTGAAELFASNKLTTLINCITWMGRSLLTVGLRFVKVWRPDDAHNHDFKPTDSPSNLLTPRHRDSSSRLSDFGRSIFTPKHKTLHGKNSLLNELLECNFIAALALSNTKSIICADTGEICVLDDAGKTPNISLAGVVEFPITAARLRDGQTMEVLGSAGQTKSFPLSDVASAFTSSNRSKRQTIIPIRGSGASLDAIVATAELDGMLVELTASRAVTISRIQTEDEGYSSIQIPAHKVAILGIKALETDALPTARFLTYSADGMVYFWDAEGSLVSSLTIPIASRPENSDQLPNELKVVTPTCDGNYLIAGDKYGILMLVEVSTEVCIRKLRAHSAEISDISTAKIEGTELVATAGRDRVVQLFLRNGTGFEHLQTLDEHAGAVGGVLIDSSGQRLISFSTDRTIVIREALFHDDHPSRPIVFSIDRTIVLKSSPSAIALSSDNHLFTAAVDRCIAKYNMRDGQCVQTFKCADNEGGESVVVSKLLHLPSLHGIPCIAGVCSADKSVRLYNEQGSLLARDWGHTEGITDLVVFPGGSEDDEQTNLVTVAADSTMFVWNTRSDRNLRSPFSDGACESDETLADTKLGPALRKVISQSELSRFSSRKKSTTEDSKTSSPTNISTPVQPSSPHRLRKKTSKVSVAQPPRLEPTTQLSRRTSSRQRSPSPPSPQSLNKKRESMRRRSMATLRSKSSNDVMTNAPPLPHTGSSGLGSVASSTESISRSLRLYRKRLAATSDTVSSGNLKELDQELRLTVRAINERLQGKALDEASVSKLLEQASERIVEMLDGRIKERVESEVNRKESDGTLSMTSSMNRSIARLESFKSTESDTDSLVSAMEGASMHDRGQ